MDQPVDCPECGFRVYLELADEVPLVVACPGCDYTDEVTLHVDDPSWITWKEATE